VTLCGVAIGGAAFVFLRHAKLTAAGVQPLLGDASRAGYSSPSA
jgi:hypothetical protein